MLQILNVCFWTRVLPCVNTYMYVPCSAKIELSIHHRHSDTFTVHMTCALQKCHCDCDDMRIKYSTCTSLQYYTVISSL